MKKKSPQTIPAMKLSFLSKSSGVDITIANSLVISHDGECNNLAMIGADIEARERTKRKTRKNPHPFKINKQ